MGPPGRLHDVPVAAPPRVCYGGASTDGRYCERTKSGNIFITSTEDAELFGHLAVMSSTLTSTPSLPNHLHSMDPFNPFLISTAG